METKERLWTEAEVQERMREWRGISAPENTCEKCEGSGVRDYPSSAGWAGGAGGQTATSGVCDSCWGSGDVTRPWVNLRALRNAKAEAEWAARKCECGADDACRFVLERDEARAEMDEFAITVGYGARPEGQSGVQRLSGEQIAERWKQIEQERDEALAKAARLQEQVDWLLEGREQQEQRLALEADE